METSEVKQATTFDRDLIARILLIGSLLFLMSIIIYWFVCGDEPEKLFSLLAPLISTWIGTLLAFYFGRESFEAASKSYHEILNKISPDVLDDVLVKQVMIDKFTMVSIDTKNANITAFSLEGLRDFLDSIGKSRLPVFDGNKIKCIIHKSVISDELLKVNKATSLDDFIKANKIVLDFDLINENKKVEDARKLMNEKNYKDLFVVDANNIIVGWLTDTQIIRYMDIQKL